MAKVKYLPKSVKDISGGIYPSIHHSGSVKGMKDLYWGKNALVVKQGSYFYNVSADPKIYELAH